MRISDWSSDVCSSDLPLQGEGWVGMGFPSVAVNLCMHPTEAHPHPSPSGPVQRAGRSIDPRGSAAPADRSHPLEGEGAKQGKRSEEHTSELQSLMRSSYAVCCLTKKKHESVSRAHTH